MALQLHCKTRVPTQGGSTMSTLTAELRDQTQTARLSVNEHRVVHHAYMLLYVAFILAPIIAGLDKFFDVLVRWDQYLAPVVASRDTACLHDDRRGNRDHRWTGGALLAIRRRLGGRDLALGDHSQSSFGSRPLRHRAP